MKKLISLLLVLCLVLAMAACGGGKVDPTKPSDEAKPTDPKPTDPTVPQNPYKGTEIEVWGVAKNTYEDVSKVAANSFIDVAQVAMVEWCAANEVTLKWGGAYAQATYMAAIAGGQTPDLILTYGNFPNFANLGLTKALTAEGCAKIAEIAGNDGYTSALSYKGKSHGMLLPTNGNEVFWYNATQTEAMGIKSPKEYWEEGNWTWDTMVQYWKDCTKDLDGDGVFDTYGISSNYLPKLADMVAVEAADGKISTVADTARFRKFADIVYNGVTEGWIQIGTKACLDIMTPYCMTRMGDNELYNVNHTYWPLKNGEICEVVPMPKYSKDEVQLNNRLSYTLFMCSSNDNQAATEAMLAYVMQCSLKYMSEMSQGAVKFDMEGIQGKTEIGKAWKASWEAKQKDIKARIEQLEDDGIYDAEHVAKLWDLLVETTPSTLAKAYSGVDNPYYPTEKRWGYMFTEPAASSVAKVIETSKTQCEKYNNTYVFN